MLKKIGDLYQQYYGISLRKLTGYGLLILMALLFAACTVHLPVIG